MTIYFMLTGSIPVQGTTFLEIASSVCHQDPVPVSQLQPQVPEYLEQLIASLLAKQPADRPQSAQEVLDILRNQALRPSNAQFCPNCARDLWASANNGDPIHYCPGCGNPLDAHQALVERCLACGGAVGCAPSCPICHRPFGHVDHRLEFTNGTLTGKVFRVPQGQFDVGRSQLDPAEPMISRRHFQVCCVNGKLYLQDAQSTNKTYIDGKLAGVSSLIQAGQQLRVAGAMAVYRNPTL